MNLTRARLAWLVVAFALVVGATTAVFLTRGGGDSPPAPPVAATAPTPTSTWPSAQQTQPAVAPESLQIKGIGVDAPVLPMGTAEDGSQEVPTTLTDTSWWRHGGRPGGPGNTVITGHAAHLASQHGVFDDLGELAVGDTFQITTATGAVDYTVTRKLDVPRAEFTDHADGIYRRTGASGAVLMTCASWNGQVWDSTTIVWATVTGSAAEPGSV